MYVCRKIEGFSDLVYFYEQDPRSDENVLPVATMTYPFFMKQINSQELKKEYVYPLTTAVRLYTAW